MGLKFDGDYIKDGSKKVGKLKKGRIYEGTSTSSSKCLATIKNEYIYSGTSTSSSKCIGTVKGDYIYQGRSTSSSKRMGKLKDAERVISGRCSDEVLGAIYILHKRGHF